jgi:hypothetical protein
VPRPAPIGAQPALIGARPALIGAGNWLVNDMAADLLSLLDPVG